MTPQERLDILANVKYKDWRFVVGREVHGAPYLQLQWTGENGFPCTSRKWLLSDHMTKSELVQTAFKAVLTAEEHEVREMFLYKEAAIFGPHFDVDDMRYFMLDTRP